MNEWDVRYDSGQQAADMHPADNRGNLETNNVGLYGCVLMICLNLQSEE